MIIDRHSGLACALSDGVIRDPLDYDHSVRSFNAYLIDHGVQHFTGQEFCRVRHPSKIHLADDALKEGGKFYFLPRNEWWPRGLVCALVVDRARQAIGRPISLANWYRPAANYNKAVGGAPKSGHVRAYSVDVDFQTANDHDFAYKRIIEPMYRTRLFGMSVGRGLTRMHLGFWDEPVSRKGQRQWSYPSRKSP